MSGNVKEFSFSGLRFVIEEDKIRMVSAFGSEPHRVNDVYTFAEVQVAGQDHPAHHGAKYFYTSECGRLRYVSHHTVRTETGEDVLTIVQKSELTQVASTFVSYPGTSVIRAYNTVRNIADRSITLEYVDSFFSYCLGESSVPRSQELYLYEFTNSWHCECQISRQSFFERGLFNGNGNHSLKKIFFANTGNWSTKERLPQAIIEDVASGQFLMFEIESACSWYYEIGENAGQLYLNLSGPNLNNSHWSKTLAPGESFETVKCAVWCGRSLGELAEQLTVYRRRLVEPSAADAGLPTIFNEYMHCAWNNPTEEHTAQLAVYAKEAGADVYVIDCGWHNEEEDCWRYIGDWRESKRRYPSGLKKTIDLIHGLGMKAGLWLEIECVGMNNTALIEKLGKDSFFCRAGEPVIDAGRLILDFRNPKVIAHADEVVDRLVRDYAIDYIKFDYNQETGPGTEVNSDSLGDGLLESSRALIAWKRRVRARHPGLILENCASGGQRMDYETLSVHALESTSDQTDYRRYPFITGNMFWGVLPEQSAVWSYPVDTLFGYEATEESVAANMINTFLGRMHLSSSLDKLSPHLFALVKEGVAYQKSLSSMKTQALPYFPLGFTDFTKKSVACGLLHENKLYLAVWNIEGKEVEISLPGLRALRAKVAYPASLPCSFRLEEGSLHIVFREDHSARFFELEVERRKEKE